MDLHGQVTELIAIGAMVRFNPISAKDLHLTREDELLDPVPIEILNVALAAAGSNDCFSLTLELFELWVKAAVEARSEGRKLALKMFGKNFTLVPDDMRHYEIITDPNNDQSGIIIPPDEFSKCFKADPALTAGQESLFPSQNIKDDFNSSFLLD